MDTDIAEYRRWQDMNEPTDVFGMAGRS